MGQKQIRDSLLEQLRLKNKSADFYKDMVADYMAFWKIKQNLIKDIREKGIRYEAVNGNGIKVDKVNESVVSLQKTTAIMLKILNDLDLREPLSETSDEDAYL